MAKTKTTKITVQAECSSCHGTGLYSGMFEVEGTAVVCWTCEGSGCEQITYIPFTGRRGKRGIKSVFPRDKPGPITYRAFLAGKRP